MLFVVGERFLGALAHNAVYAEPSIIENSLTTSNPDRYREISGNFWYSKHQKFINIALD